MNIYLLAIVFMCKAVNVYYVYNIHVLVVVILFIINFVSKFLLVDFKCFKLKLGVLPS